MSIYLRYISLFIHLFRGDRDKALEWLERACEERDSWLPSFLDWPIKSHSIPDDPVFNEILKKYGLR